MLLAVLFCSYGSENKSSITEFENKILSKNGIYIWIMKCIVITRIVHKCGRQAPGSHMHKKPYICYIDCQKLVLFVPFYNYPTKPLI